MKKNKKRIFVAGIALITVILAAIGGYQGAMYFLYGIHTDQIEVKSYRNLKAVCQKKETPSEETIKNAMEYQLSEDPPYTKEMKRNIKKKDVVHIDYEGKVENQSFEGGSKEGYDLEIGSGVFLDGFEEGLIGYKPGDSVTLKLKFPSDYYEKDVAGKNVTFQVKIHFIKKMIPMTETSYKDDAFLKKYTKYQGSQDFRKQVLAKLNKEAEVTFQRNKREAAWKALIKRTKMKELPKKEVNEEIKETNRYYEEYAKYVGLSMDDFLMQYLNTGKDKFDKQNEEYARQTVAENYLAKELAKKADIRISETQYKTMLQRLFSQYQYESAEAFEQNVGKKELKKLFLKIKVQEFLVQHTEFTYKNYEAKNQKDAENTAQKAKN